jgi:hypothetical protein
MTYLAAYVLGVVMALAIMRDPWPERVATALVWPLGPLAFLVVVPVLLVAAAILWPVPVLGSAAIVGVLVYLLGC